MSNSNKVQLKAVKTSRADSCLTYALKRIGYPYNSEDVVEVEWIDKLTNLSKISDKPKKGDIGVWRKDKKKNRTGSSITKEGLVIEDTREDMIHFCVYEGKGLISDMTSYHLIRIRKMEELKTQPSYWLRYEGAGLGKG